MREIIDVIISVVCINLHWFHDPLRGTVQKLSISIGISMVTFSEFSAWVFFVDNRGGIGHICGAIFGLKSNIGRIGY